MPNIRDICVISSQIILPKNKAYFASSCAFFTATIQPVNNIGNFIQRANHKNRREDQAPRGVATFQENRGIAGAWPASMSYR